MTTVKLTSDMAVDYKLLGGTSVFNVNSVGEIRTVSNIDREIIAEYKLGVLALAHRNPHLVAFTKISVQILDINDNLPRFHSDNYTVTIAENVEETTSVYRGIKCNGVNLFIDILNIFYIYILYSHTLNVGTLFKSHSPVMGTSK